MLLTIPIEARADVTTSTVPASSVTTSTASVGFSTTTTSTSTVSMSTPRVAPNYNTSSSPVTIGSYIGSLNFSNGYSFEIYDNGAYLKRFPLNNPTVVVPDSVCFDGKRYNVVGDDSSYTVKGSGKVTTIVFPPTVSCVNFEEFYNFTTLKSLIYTSSEQPSLSFSGLYYYNKLCSSGVCTTADYSNYTKDNLVTPKIDSVMSHSDNFNLGSVVVDGCEYELYSGKYASPKQFSYSTSSFNVKDSVTYNGLVFKVIELDDASFEDDLNVTEINLPDTIKYYSGTPFKNLINLQHVYCPTQNGLPASSTVSSLFDNCGTSTIQPLKIVPVSTATSVPTGDSSNFLLWSFMSILALAFMLCFIFMIINIRPLMGNSNKEESR